MGWFWGAWVDSWDDEGDHASVFVEVDDLDEAIKATEGAETLVPRRQTFYGMDEVFVRAPLWHPGRPKTPRTQGHGGIRVAPAPKR
jgi:hypothetical protein